MLCANADRVSTECFSSLQIHHERRSNLVEKIIHQWNIRLPEFAFGTVPSTLAAKTSALLLLARAQILASARTAKTELEATGTCPRPSYRCGPAHRCPQYALNMTCWTVFRVTGLHPPPRTGEQRYNYPEGGVRVEMIVDLRWVCFCKLFVSVAVRAGSQGDSRSRCLRDSKAN